MANELHRLESHQRTLDEPMMKRLREKEVAREFQERRHKDWDDNYELYRNIVKTNRLTQRQAVNIPLMKETVRTLLSKMDDPPAVEWKELSGEQMKEMVFQEMWNEDYKRLNMEGIDIQDKKTVLVYGRGFKKLNWDGMFECDALDIYDIVVDPMVNPIDLETARYIVHQNIFKSLEEILDDDRYTAEGKKALKTWVQSEEGMVQSNLNVQEWEKKMERLRSAGVKQDELKAFASGEVLVNLTEHYHKEYNKDTGGFDIWVTVYADDTTALLEEKLTDLLGVDFYPFVTWGEDVETADFWSDGVGDLIRTPNKVINVWYSQMIENRTLQNFQMHWYDATQANYTPQTYEPGQGRMLPAPGDPNKTIMPVAINGLDETMNAIGFVTQVVERATATTAIEKGMSTPGEKTKAEVEILVGKATERITSLTKFYRRSWEEFAYKWEKIINANQKSKVTVFKVSNSGKIYPKFAYPVDWKSDRGYKAIVRSASEEDSEKIRAIQKMQFIMGQFPNNPALIKIAQRRMLAAADLTPDEMKEVENAEAQAQQSRTQVAAQGAEPQPGQREDTTGLEEQNLQQQIQQNLQQLGQA